jgi:ABC-2 type transport system permease protein
MSKFLRKPWTLFLILVGVNVLAAFFYWRIDLTEDKRYSLSPATRAVVKNIKEPVVIKVYLAGEDLPGGFVRLQKSIAQTLEEIKRLSPSKIDFQFIDPNAGTEEERQKMLKELVEKGMQPTNIFDKKDGKNVQTVIFPYATLWQNNKEDLLLLLKGNLSESSQNRLNQSAEIAEHTLASALKKFDASPKKKVALLAEYTSLKPVNFAGLINSLQENYLLYILQASTSPNFEGINALILPKPDKAIPEETKIKIDQYIMSGGKVLFFMDGLRVDSVAQEGSFATPLEIGLDDMLFKYGLRINKNMVKDGQNAAFIPMVVGNMGDKPNIQPVQYRYFPLINNFGPSLVTKNIDMVLSKYASSIDTVSSGVALTKTALLLTSPYTKVLNAPAVITYNEAKTDTDPKEYSAGTKVLAYMVEGEFQSLYANRLGMNLKKSSPHTKILVCSDGDLVKNEMEEKSNNPLPLGYDKFAKHQYGNQDFVANALNYMLDEKGLISARSKSLVLRPLDNLKIQESKKFWQSINVGLPLVLLALLGLIRFLWIKKQYKKA